MRFENMLRKTISIFVLSVFVLLILNNNFYLHNHKLSDGSIITHAHPFDKKGDTTPFKSHHHSKAQFFILSSTSLFIFIFAISALIFFAVKQIILLLPFKNNIASQKYFLHFLVRGPPAIS